MTLYSVEVCKDLERRFISCHLARPFRVVGYDPGDLPEYDIAPVLSGGCCKVTLLVEKFVGGGFAGQVYKVRGVSSGRFVRPGR